MDWLKAHWHKPSYKRLVLHELNSNTDVIKGEQTRHELSIGVTLINLLLTVVTITIVFISRKPPTQLNFENPPCHCLETSVDSRYTNHGMNADLKRITGYCEFGSSFFNETETDSFNIAPLLDEIDLSPSPKVLNGAFHDNTTIFTQDPSPEVDEAWELFSEDIFLTSWPTVRDAGRSLSKSIHFPPAVDGEPGKYIATWDVFHQIHCLNTLRKATNWEYYYGDHKPTPKYLMHQKHCIRMLLQSLMCSADVDMITFEWMEGHDTRVEDIEVKKEDGTVHKRINQAAIPAANFNVHKMCRNFSAILDWAKKNKEDDPVQTRRKLIVPENSQLNLPEDY